MSHGPGLFPVLAGRLEAEGLDVRVAVPRSGNSAVLVVASPGARERGEVRIGSDGSVVFAYGETTDNAGITRLIKDVTGYLSRRAPGDGQGPVPLYVQVSDDIRQAIADGAYKHVLPTHGELAQKHDVSLVTLRRALETLEAEGLIVVRQGRGTFIN